MLRKTDMPLVRRSSREEHVLKNVTPSCTPMSLI